MIIFFAATAAIFLTLGLMAWIADNWPAPYDWTEADSQDWQDYSL